MLKAMSRTSVDLKTIEVISSLLQIVNTKKATCNDKVAELEKAYARYIGTKNAVAFPYSRTGTYYALKALGLEEGDEVILPAFTFWVDAAMVVMAGLKPVFVDVQFDTQSIDHRKITKAITARTKVIYPTHLNGLPADMDPIMKIAKKHNLRVVEDCARSCGATYKGKRIGSFDIGSFSFGYGKSFYGFGGAMVTSDDDGFISKLRDLKSDFSHISTKELCIQTIKGSLLKYLNLPYLYRFSLYPLVYQFQVKGKEEYAGRFRVKMPSYDSVPDSFKVDMNNVQARLGLSQLKRIDSTNRKRMENAEILSDQLSNIPGLHIPRDFTDRENVSVHYAIWTERSKELQRFLTIHKIDAQDETAIDTTTLERFKPYAKGKYPNAQKLHNKLIFLPTHISLGKKDMLYIAGKVKEFFGVK
ncbi:MAG: DegT/DnrJ/EryC1/StrS family aminotransferase [Candidatus Scalindua sp.]|nr:DegT/DnrJ/EryC1/StrS family aminotransferase [Candidatus Scalindua sp.]